MSIQRNEQGFYEWPDYTPPSLGIESDRLEECLAHCREHSYRGVFGSPPLGFCETDLNFLKQIPAVESL